MSTDKTPDEQPPAVSAESLPDNQAKPGRRRIRKAGLAASAAPSSSESADPKPAAAEAVSTAEVEPVTQDERPAMQDVTAGPAAIDNAPSKPQASRFAPLAAMLLIAIGGSVAAAAYGAHSAREAVSQARSGDTQTMERLAKTLDDLTVRVEALTQASRQPQAASDSASLKAVQTSIDRARQDLTGQIAKLSARVDELDKTGSELRERVAAQGMTPEKPVVIPAPAQVTAADPAPGQSQPSQADEPRTAALSPPANVPLPPATTERPAAAPEAPRETPLRGWTILEVNRGVALIEGRGGVYEITRGSTLPAIGRVESIERRGRGWVIVTSRGVIQGPGIFSSW